MTISLELSNIIVDPAAYADPARIDAAFAQIRKDTPFAVANPDGYDPFWVASKYEDIMDIERRADVFHNGDRCSNLQPTEGIKQVEAFTGGEPNLIRSLVSVDGAEHKALRAITFSALTPKALKTLRDDVQKIASEFADHMVSLAPKCDFATDVALLYPLKVVMRVLGVPEEDEPLMLKLTQELFGNQDPDLNRSGAEVSPIEAAAALNSTMLELEAYFEQVTKRFRAEPTQHLNSLIANAKIDGEYLTRRQMMGYYIIAATAGHDTTSNTTSAAFWALAERPELLARLKAEPDKIAGFVEESIRWSTAVRTFMRSATQDTEVGGRKVAKGDWILLAYHSAARDEDVFENPFEFNIDRPAGKQISFGSGPHVCLGQHLARMEMRLLWEELIPRLETVELDGVPQMSKSNFVIGPKSVPVRFTVS